MSPGELVGKGPGSSRHTQELIPREIWRRTRKHGTTSMLTSPLLAAGGLRLAWCIYVRFPSLPSESTE